MGWFDFLFGKSPDYQGMAQSLADNTIDLFEIDQCIKQNKLEKQNMSVTDWQMQQDIQNDLNKTNQSNLRQYVDSEAMKQKMALSHPIGDVYRAFPVKYQSDKLLVVEYHSDSGVVEQTFDILTWDKGIYPVHIVETKPALNSMIMNKSPCRDTSPIADIMKRKIHHVIVSVKTQRIVGFVLQQNGVNK